MPQSFLKKITKASALNGHKPLRSEILSKELLGIHAAETARQSGTVGKKVKSARLKANFKENCKVLNNAYFTLSEIASRKEYLAAGAEWLLDNYHVIDEQVREIRRDLPSSYYKALPRLSSGRWKGFPRTFQISCDYIEHTDSVIQLETLSEYIQSYQTEQTLNINELWAVPIMLRLALVDNLRRLSQSVLNFSLERQRAQDLFNKIVYRKNISATEILSQILVHVTPGQHEVENIFPLLSNRLRTLGSSSALGIQWLEEKAREKNVDLAEITKKHQQLQASDQISIGNAVTSLKSLGRLDWRAWVESQSSIDQILRKESSGIYLASDFYTRDLIRHKIEDLSRKYNHTETEVADTVLSIAEKQFHTDQLKDQLHRTHVGYYLIDNGVDELKKQLRKSESTFSTYFELLRQNAFNVYIAILAVTTLTLALTLSSSIIENSTSIYLYLFCFLILLIPSSQLALEFIQWLSAKLITPEPLSKLDFEKGVPEKAASIVVIQSILSSKDHLLHTIDDLEIRAIGNKDKNVSFGILADLPDSISAENTGDSELISSGIKKIRELNDHYKNEALHFFILFRNRKWNPSEQKYISWERKRGKLIEFNRLLRGSTETSFTIIEANLEKLRKAQFVITLDNDTQLPPGTARKIIGCASHPLNIPVVCQKKKITSRGYGIIQPRVGITLESATASKFSELYSGQSGLDPYTRTISDIYQDIFKEASFIGKGIYHIDTFIQTLDTRFPENSILSHDLLESGYVRCGLASDIEVFDEFPKRYHSFSKRQHRWIRGDWQLLPWLFPQTPTFNGFEKNNLSPLVKWKLFDNLRRSFLPLALLFFVSLLPSSAGVQVFLSVLFLLTGFRVYSLLYSLVFDIPLGYSLSTHFISVLKDLRTNISSWLFDLATVPHQAYVSTDAIVRTIYRVFSSKKNLLEWETALSSEQRLKPDLESFIKNMWATYAILLPLALLPLYVASSQNLLLYYAILLAWAFSPIVAWHISKDATDGISDISEVDQKYLRGIAYDTWRYFRNHLQEKYNYLIPDNIQQNPQSVVAERTSPTNISLSLLAVSSAHDLGFIPSPQVYQTSRKVIDSVLKLERYQGHLLNWYAINDLRPLHPRYVSSVDSGNFVGHLVVMKEALRTLPYSAFLNEKNRETLTTLLSTQQSEKITKSSNEIYYTAVPALENSEINLRSFSPTQKELFEDFSRIIPFTKWISKLDILEELGKLHILPKKLGRVHDILKNRTLSPFLAYKIVSRILESKEKIYKNSISQEQRTALDELFNDLQIAQSSISELINGVTTLCDDIERLIEETKFDFLYDKQKKLLSIGYNIENASLDNASYDLLASEARLGSFMGIAKGDLPHVHWFFLGRALTESPGGKALVSWSGTMFEYLMPILVMKNYPSTLMGRTYTSVIKAQQSYCFRRGVPWGISESAYGTVDFEKTYQYRAFGVPGLGLKRGLVDDLVISPYSSALALQVSLQDATKNLHALETIGARGEYGFYEAIDYTPERLSSEESFHIIKSFFAHHQGMSITAINNVLNKNIVQERFHKDLRVQSCNLLLQERFPTRIPLIQPHKAELLLIESVEHESRYQTQETLKSPHQPFPRTHLLSNGEYTVCIDHRGNGFSSYKNEYLANRFKPNSRYANYGQYLYIKDEKKDVFWSSTFYPCKQESDSYEVLFAPDKAEFQRRDYEIHSTTEVVISPEDNLEIRKLALTNHSQENRRLSVTSYLEIALASARADAAHPAFSKLFVETKWISYPEAVFCIRRPRAGEKDSPVLFHFSSSEVVWEPTQFTTDRSEFIGRGSDLSEPRALLGQKPLTQATGYVLDPCASIRQIIELDPGESTNIYFITGFAENEEEALYLCKKYKEMQSIKRASELAWSHANVEQKNQQFLKSSTLDFQHLGNLLIYPNEELRDSLITMTPEQSQTGLWKMGISGDEPILLYYIDDTSYLSHFQEVILAHEFLRNRGVIFDLVVLNDKSDGYIQELGDELESSVRASFSAHLLNQRGGIFIRNKHHISDEDSKLLRAAASIILDATKGDLAKQLDFASRTANTKKVTPAHIRSHTLASTEVKSSRKDFNPVIGRFSKGGRAYQLTVDKDSLPPLPWSNVIANKDIGCLVTETGAGYSWVGNSRENRVTAWSNDPVTDPHSEAIFIRDCETSAYWSPTPLPVPVEGSVDVIHEPGISTFNRKYHGITSTLETFVSVEAPVRYWILSLENTENKARTLEVILYLDWVLGVSRSESLTHLFTGVAQDSGFLYAKNHWNDEFKNSFIFLGANLPLQDFTTEQRNFLGYSSSLAQPHFLEQLRKEHDSRLIKARTATGSTLSRKTGFGFDSAAILKYEVHIPAQSETQIAFYLSSTDSLDVAKRSVASLNKISLIQKEKEQVGAYWDSILGTFQVETPDNDFNTMINTWLPYQSLACRMYARTGYYQSSGAFGFRDQLQDSLAFLSTKPEITRNQILINCTRQFIEGDVQHWWHPPSGRGIRSKISDNYLWLPFALMEYLDVTGDRTILDETASYIAGPGVPEDHHDIYFVPESTDIQETVFEHCVRALDRSFPLGPHGLPLIGTGDWNDGMNKVGEKGTGESVWLGWFLASILKRFSRLLEEKGDTERVEKYLAHSEKLVSSVEKNAWDGAWYRRAYFDDGTPLGSSERDECAIDSLAQSWSIITGLGNTHRRRQAIESAYDRLFDKDNQLVRLLWPPFSKSDPSPGYIQSYPPGIRENGGQYTHGSSWMIAALSLEGLHDQAVELFTAMNPVTHTDTIEKAMIYKTEPYVTCGDVYSHELHAGRGGWSWYTGSSGWLYQIAIKYILGIQVTADGLKIKPGIPSFWKGYSCNLTCNNRKIRLLVRSGTGKETLTLNDSVLSTDTDNHLIPWEEFNESVNSITLDLI